MQKYIVIEQAIKRQESKARHSISNVSLSSDTLISDLQTEWDSAFWAFSAHYEQILLWRIAELCGQRCSSDLGIIGSMCKRWVCRVIGRFFFFSCQCHQVLAGGGVVGSLYIYNERGLSLLYIKKCPEITLVLIRHFINSIDWNLCEV